MTFPPYMNIVFIYILNLYSLVSLNSFSYLRVLSYSSRYYADHNSSHKDYAVYSKVVLVFKVSSDVCACIYEYNFC